MEIIQEAFNIPEDISVGLATGVYRRIGGVVRYARGSKKGQIVKHLDPIKIADNNKAVMSIGEKALNYGKNHKKMMIGSLAVAGVAATGGGLYLALNKRKRERVQNSFNKYINAIRSGNLDVEIIENLEKDLKDVKSINLSASELSLLVNYIREYTMSLAENNNYKVKLKETSTPIIDLQQYLKMQKRIMKLA